MKKKMKKIGLLMLCVMMFTGLSMTAYATDRSYTYNYDWWGGVQDSPDVYTVCNVYTSTDFGLDVSLKSPEGLFIQGNMVYICDTGNNRIIELERISTEEFEVRRIYDSFQGDVENKTFSSPSDIAVSEEGDIYIADKGNARILKLDHNLNYLMQFDKPVDSSLDPETNFTPNKNVIDTAGRVYCIATGINKGLIKYEADGVFSGFVGATKAKYDWVDYIWKKFATQEQRAQM